MTTTPEGGKPRGERIEVHVSAELRVDGKTSTATTRNLSLGGVCLETSRPLTEGKLVKLTLFVVEEGVESEGTRGLELTGTVQWSAEAERGHAIGIKFGNLTSAQSAALTNALRAVSEP